jgi:hypothetical protein
MFNFTGDLESIASLDIDTGLGVDAQEYWIGYSSDGTISCGVYAYDSDERTDIEQQLGTI